MSEIPSNRKFWLKLVCGDSLTGNIDVLGKFIFLRMSKNYKYLICTTRLLKKFKYKL